MSAAVEDMYLYTSALKFQHKHHHDLVIRKRHHSESSEDDSSSPKSSSGSPSSPSMDDDRRAHHNELERRRRDHIKDHFVILKDSIPLLDGEKSSRALILKRAVEYISVMQSRLGEHERSIMELRRKNELLEDKLRERETPVSPPAPAVMQPALQTALPSALPTALPNSLPAMSSPPAINPTQMSLPVLHQQMPPLPVSQPLPQVPMHLSTIDPALLNTMISSNQDAIFALTNALLTKLNPSGNMAQNIPVPASIVEQPPVVPVVPVSVAVPITSAGSPPGIYPPIYSPPDQQQMAVQF